MTTRIHSGGPATGVAATPTAPRVTPPPARPFRQVVQAGKQAVVSGAEAAVRRLPGGPVLAAAVRPPPSLSSPSAPNTSAEGSTGTAPMTDGGSGPGGVLGDGADQNLYYLELQQRIAAESREYTALSNVLKARHDTMKNAIGNIR